MPLVAHELAHVQDLSGRAVVGPAWQVEGYAVWAEFLWSVRTLGAMAPLANSADVGSGRWQGQVAQVTPCAGTDRTALRALRSGWSPDVYGMGCAVFAHAWGLAVARGLPSLVMSQRWHARGTGTGRVGDVARVLWREPVTTRVPLGQWLLSWYADDFVPDVAMELTQPATRWRTAVDRVEPAGFAATQGVPALHLTSRVGWEVEMPLSGQDAVFLQLEVERPVRLRPVRATADVALGILRVR